MISSLFFCRFFVIVILLGSLVPAGTFYPPYKNNVNHSSPLESKELVSHPESKTNNTSCSPRGMRNILHPSYQKCPRTVTTYNNVSSVYHDKTYAPDEISSRSEDNGFTSETTPTKSNNNTSTDSFGSESINDTGKSEQGSDFVDNNSTQGVEFPDFSYGRIPVHMGSGGDFSFGQSYLLLDGDIHLKGWYQGDFGVKYHYVNGGGRTVTCDDLNLLFFVHRDETLVLENLTVVASGGGQFVHNEGTCICINCTFIGFTSPYDGGAVFFNEGGCVGFS